MKVKVTTFDWDSAVLARSVEVIAGKWKVKIISHLFGGTKRFSELCRLLPGVHRGTLTYELRGLQADGIIHRTQYPTIPPTVEYKLTARGTALRPALIYCSGGATPRNWKYLLRNRIKVISQGHDVSSGPAARCAWLRSDY